MYVYAYGIVCERGLNGYLTPVPKEPNCPISPYSSNMVLIGIMCSVPLYREGDVPKRLYLT